MKKVLFDKVDTQLCADLKPLEEYLRQQGVIGGWISRNGQDYSPIFKTVVLIEEVLVVPVLRKKLKLPRCVRNWDDFDYKTGGEYGFHCIVHQDALIGTHPKSLGDNRNIS